ncbi:MAG: DUF4292 domain-containing protein [candidate division KSB1 bacterium]|nr:DUF4292 domain-containing protein [candidate division KSB1 bacterium]MDZ7319494.1 DUF4292 domain-containing protein [candidate division KSB1 bacterium]MDZ7340995.1 DUF4292 domain-containing protein [candidate division KSB1 bacterium]
MKRIIHILIPVLVLTGNCARIFHKRPAETATISIDEIRYRLARTDLKWHTIRGNAQISVESPKINFSAIANIAIKKPDSILVKIKGPFNLGTAALFLDHNQFLFYNSFENSVYSGSPENLPWGRFMPIEIKTDRLLQALSGMPRLDYFDRDSVGFEHGQYTILGFQKNQRIKYWIDAKKFVVTKLDVLDQQSQPVIIIYFKQFETRNEVTMPKMIQMLQPQRKTRITILYENRKSNIPLSANDFFIRVPDQAEWIKL